MSGMDVPTNDYAYLDEYLDELEASARLLERPYAAACMTFAVRVQ
jgi:hypothetical protein